ncbi:MAG: sensor histidine kinase [Ruminococcus sp.]|jgi:signal transduction histidine kinase
MKRLLRIYRRYCITAVVLAVLLIVLNMAGMLILSWYNMTKAGNDSSSKWIFRGVADSLVEQNKEGYSLTDTGETYLADSQAAFLMLLDEKTGEILYSWHLPEKLNHPYNLGEVASFSRWYLEDYPVKVWNTENGLLVLGSQIGSVVQFSVSYQRSQIDTLLQWIPISLALNLAVILLMVLILGQRFNRSLSPIDSGIQQLARGEKLAIKGRGLVKELAQNLNQASDILQEQKRRVNRRDTARTEWIAGVSHDIRTPLSMILGYAENLENSGNLSKEERHQISVIKEQSIRIRRLIEDLNLTSKLSYQMQPLRMASYRPAVLLRQVVADFLNQGMEEKYEIELELEPGLEQYKKQGDVQLIKRAVENLIQNSIRHNPGGCRVTVRSWIYEERVVISVSDDGCGIPPEVKRSLIHEEQPPKGVHIMGLRIVKQIVEAHQGSFSLSEDGKEVQMRL